MIVADIEVIIHGLYMAVAPLLNRLFLRQQVWSLLYTRLLRKYRTSCTLKLFPGSCSGHAAQKVHDLCFLSFLEICKQGC